MGLIKGCRCVSLHTIGILPYLPNRTAKVDPPSKNKQRKIQKNKKCVSFTFTFTSTQLQLFSFHSIYLLLNPLERLFGAMAGAASKLGFTLTTPRLSLAPSPKPVNVSCPTKVHSFRFVGPKFSVPRRLFIISPKATTDQSGQIGDGEIVDGKIMQKKSLGELEQDFLQALQSFYYEGKAIMSNEEFDNLKEELMWEGSSVVMLSSDEQKFLEASMAYVSGKPILSDKDYDDLKVKLKTEGSDIVVEGPRCSLRSRKVYSDLSVDYLKMFLLNVPAAVVAVGLFFFLDDITGFEITYLLELPEPFSFIFTWFAAIPLIVYLSSTFTNAIVKDFLILKGACPNCGTENNSFYGTILSISSGGATNKVKCSNCGTELVFNSKTRLITLPEGSEA